MNQTWQQMLAKRMESRREQHQLRQLIPVQKRGLLDMLSNDYLGLSQHPLLIERSTMFAKEWGAGSTASRLAGGNLPFFSEIERKLADLKKTEAALILNSGYQANVALISALADRSTTLFLDRLCHNSLLQGASLSGAKVKRYRHQDLEHLEQLLLDSDSPRKMIVTESLFSMDGDVADLEQLIQLKERFGALLYVDEAHATGMVGVNGMGLTVGRPEVDVSMGTFGKGAGSFGAYVACSQQLADFFANFCGGFLFATALPPAIIGSIDAALELIPTFHEERRNLMSQAETFRNGLNAIGFDTGESTTQIVPVMLESEEAALRASLELKEAGILVLAVRPPTVPQGCSRLRFSISASHDQSDIQRVLASMVAIAKSNHLAQR